MIRQGQAQHVYQYDPQNGLGVMGVGNDQLPILVIENFADSVLRCLPVHHKNQIHYKFHDQNANRLICEQPDSTLRDYLANTLVTQMVSKFSYVDLTVKTAFQEMIQYITDMHERNFKLDPFNEENIKVLNGTVKFVNVGLTKFTGPFRSKLTLDYNNLANVITSLLHGQLIPPDLKHFLSQIDQNAGIIYMKDSNSLLHHLCLKSPCAILRFCINLGSDLLDRSMLTTRSRKIGKVRECPNWDENIDGADFGLLKRFMLGKATLSEQRNPGGKPASYVTSTKGNYTHAQVKYSLHRFIRNMAVHLKPVGSTPSTDPVLELQLLIFHAFRSDLLSVQKELCEEGDGQKWFE